MIAWDAIENAVRAWVLPASGLASNRVYFADQDVPATEAAPRVTIRIGGPVHLGIDAIEQSFDPGQPAGQEILQTARGFRTVTVDLQSFAPTMVGAGDTALAVMAKIQAALSLPSVRYALNAAGLGVLQEGSIQRIPQVRQTINEDRATLSVRFCVTQSISERLGYIESVEVRYGQGPILLMDGARDVAGFANFERWARADQPSFPRLVAGPQGRPGVQFSRIGADVISSSARNMGHLRDLATPAASVLRLVTGELSIGFWFRRDPLVVLAGVSSPSYRIITVSGADGTIGAQGCIWGITYSPTSVGYILNTQTAANVGGSSINGNASTFTTPAQFGVWEHVVAVVKRNGLDVLPLEVGATVDWYLNGAFAFSQVGTGGTGSIGPRIPQWQPFEAPRYVTSIGAGWSNTNRVFINGLDGSVADLVAYPRALSAAEVETLYTTGPFGLRV